MKLIVMACCGTKRSDEGLMPLIDRYDGPMWRTLRARLAELPAAAEAVKSRELLIMVLSAKWGFIPAEAPMPNYDERMTERRARELLQTDPELKYQLPQRFDEASDVLFVGGELYRDTMWKAVDRSLWHLMKVAETDGAGIGYQRQQLNGWLGEHYGAVA